MIANNKKETITTNQIVWLIVALGPMGIITLPREISLYAQQSGWIMLTLAYLPVLLFSRFIYMLAKRYPGKNIIAINDIILGKALGRSVSLFLIFLLIFASATSVRLQAEIVNIYLLIHTPMFVIILAMLLAIMYVINNGIGTIARFNEILQPLIIFVFLVVLFLTLPDTDFSNFLPLISDEISWRKVVMPSLYPYILLFAIPFLSHFSPQPKQLWRGMFWAILIIFIRTLMLFIFIIALFGTVETQYIQYPSIDLTRVIQFPVLERMEILFMIFWVSIEFGVLTVFCYLGSLSLQKLITKGSFFRWSLILILIISVLSLLPDNIDDTKRVASYLQKLSIGTFFIFFPLLVFIDSLKKRVKR